MFIVIFEMRKFLESIYQSRFSEKISVFCFGVVLDQMRFLLFRHAVEIIVVGMQHVKFFDRFLDIFRRC